MNKHITDSEVQDYIHEHLNSDVHKLAMAKSPFAAVTAQELANQIAARKKSARKLPAWFSTYGIYYPALLSIEQCSSELTARYKARLSKGTSLIDITGGFGVDSFYFAGVNERVIHCEINPELSAIAQYNAQLLSQHNCSFIPGDGITYLRNSAEHFGTIYIDPARRSDTGKVFMLKDCSPNVVEDLDFLLSKADTLIIKTAPLLDISAGLKELKHVSEIHIVSVRNECKELIWVLNKDFEGRPQITCTTLNKEEKEFSFLWGDETGGAVTGEPVRGGYLYEPDVALLKSGAFNLIAERFQLKKFHPQTQLYVSAGIHPDFPGRIFSIDEVLSTGDIKKQKALEGNVIVRNYPDRAASLVSKYRIKPHDTQFLIFTQSEQSGKIVLKTTILQHY